MRPATRPKGRPSKELAEANNLRSKGLLTQERYDAIFAVMEAKDADGCDRWALEQVASWAGLILRGKKVESKPIARWDPVTRTVVRV